MLKLVCPSYHEPLVTYDQLDWCLAMDVFACFLVSPYSSDKSAGSPPSRVILFGAILDVILVIPVISLETHVVSPVAPVVETTIVASPTWLHDLISYSDSDYDSPDDMASPDKVASRPSSFEFPIAPVSAPPTICRQRTILIRPEEDIPIGQLYRTHLGGPCRELTARKSVRPLSSHCLALRYTSHHLDRFTSGSSSGHSSSDHSSYGHSILGHSLSGHTPPDTTVINSSAPARFVYPPLVSTPRCSEAYRRWRSAPLSTMYPPTTSELSAGDSSSESFVVPSRKRCRSSTATMTSPIHATRALDSVEEDIDIDVLADIEADTMVVEVAVDRNVVAGVDAGIDMEVDVEVDVEAEVEDEVESSDRGTIEVGVDVAAGVIPRQGGNARR
ncbi:hypothetical protein Tco_0431528 [Tanacetum coccineum]